VKEYGSDHTDGTLKTGVVPDEVRDAECRDAGVTACGVLLAAHGSHTSFGWRFSAVVTSFVA